MQVSLENTTACIAHCFCGFDVAKGYWRVANPVIDARYLPQATATEEWRARLLFLHAKCARHDELHRR